MTPRVSVCIIARGRLGHLCQVLAGLARQTRPADELVVVSMGDAEVATVARDHPLDATVCVVAHHDGDPLPLAAARNHAAEQASGDLLVFLDVDCIPAPTLVADYLRHRREGLVMGEVRYLPPDIPGDRDWTTADLRRHGRAHPARPAPDAPTRADDHSLFWSLNFAVTRRTWVLVGGFDDGYRGYGGEDTDLAFTARARGVDAWFVPGAEAFHQHHPTSDPPVEHLADIVANARRFRDKWGVWPMEGWLRAFAAEGLIRWHDDTLVLLEGAEAAAVR